MEGGYIVIIVISDGVLFESFSWMYDDIDSIWIEWLELVI
jgi:hypothetical protein